MKQAINIPSNRVDEALDKWEARKARYSPQAQSTREFQKAERDSLRQILKSLPYDTLSFEEKIAYRVVKGHMRAINRQLYPSRLIRWPRNIIVASFRLLLDAGKLIGRLLNVMLASSTNTNGIQPGIFQRQPMARSSAGIARTQTIAPNNQSAVVSRVATEPQAAGKIAPHRYKGTRVVHMNNASQGQTI